MNNTEFLRAIHRLEIEFEKNLKPERKDLIYDKIQGFAPADLTAAVESLIDDPKRRTFPRVADIVEACLTAAALRREDEWERKKAQERKEVDDLMNGPLGEGIRAENKRKARAIISALSVYDQAERQKEFARLQKSFLGDAISEPQSCRCDNGLVHYIKMRFGNPYSHVGNCAVCKKGYKHLPLVDPVTFQVLEVRPTEEVPF